MSARDLYNRPLREASGWYREAAFDWQRSTFDLLLTQYARLARGFDKEAYIREYARLGFTHIEVNGLATPFPIEPGVPGEYYPDFYTYCPALDQFVESRLNRGTYPAEYLQANLNNLKENARLALKYGLSPGLLCFEPRSVPAALLRKYPMLRGPRVDHPFRSFKPRFSLTLVHPLAQKHYAELIYNLLCEVPQLAYLGVWSNDSGSGFEHTRSLYVGRNGGPYLIREWKDDEEIARAAADNIARFYRLLRDSASRINPGFRVMTRLESFYGERDFLWPKLAERVDAEVNSLLVRGWENNYPHPHYKDIDVLGSAQHHTLWDKERKPLRELEARRSLAFFYHYFNAHGNHEPLLGIPFPWLTHEKLKALQGIGAKAIAHMGGLQPPRQVPYAVNQELFRLFQFNPDLDIARTLLALAQKYAGDEKNGRDLVRGWQWIDEAVRKFVPLPLYSGFGLVWMRLWVRPLVPDIEQIPKSERAYYEKFMCSAPHNPNLVDLARDVLFELVPTTYAGKAFRRIDQNVWKPLRQAQALFKRKMEQAAREKRRKALALFSDQWIRVRALKCLFETLRNTAVWIWGVHTYLESNSRSLRQRARRLLREMVDREIANCRDLLQLWESSPLEFMMISGIGETTFIHGENLPQLLMKKIELMSRHRDDEPYIDPEFMWRVSPDPYNGPSAESGG